MEDFVDATIANLKILSMVPKNGKLCIRKGQLCIDNTPRAQALRRWVNGDSRDLALIHAKNAVNSAIKIARTVMAGIVAPAGGGGESAQQSLVAESAASTAAWTLERILEELKHSERGLQNLKTTYADDSTMIAHLDVLVERQAAHCAEIEAFIQQSAKTP